MAKKTGAVEACLLFFRVKFENSNRVDIWINSEKVRKSSYKGMS